MRRSARDRLLRALGVHSVSFVISAGLFALPIVYLALQSFKSYTGFLQDPTGLPTTWTLLELHQRLDRGRTSAPS